MVKIGIILGTGRKGSYSFYVAKTIDKLLREKGLQTLFIDVRDYPQTYTNELENTEKHREYESKLNLCDAIIIVSPEYNHGYPGELKMLLDLGARKYYERKLIGLVGVSNGAIGGARCIQQLKLVIIALRAYPFPYSLYVNNVDELSREGEIITDQRFLNKAHKFIDQLIKYISMMSRPRELNI